MASTIELVTNSVADLTEKKDEPLKFRNMTTKQKVSFIREVITVEPVVSCYLMAAILCGPAIQNLEFEKACRVNEGFNDTVCDAILRGEHTNYTEENNKLQTIIAEVHSWQQPLQSIMPLILILFLGSYSDRHKLRKPFLLIPLVGELIGIIGLILCVIFMKTWSLEIQGVAQAVIPSFFGGQAMITMAIFSYIADISTIEMRTLRIGVMQIVLNFLTPVMQSFSGILFEKVGYISILIGAAALYVIGLIYGIFCIKEPHTPVNVTRKGILIDIFDPRHAIDTFALLLRKKPGNNRLLIIIMLFVLFVSTTVIVGEGSVYFLYTQLVFQWTIVEFSYFITANTVIHLIGTIIALPLLTRVFKFDDLTIIGIGFLDKVIPNIIYAFTTTVVGLYVATLISLVMSIATIAIRSLATKIVSEDDLGKAQSLFAICEAIAPAIAVPLYNEGIYTNTLTTFPGAYFLAGVAFYVIALLILGWMYITIKRRKNPTTVANGVEENASKNGHITDEQTTHM